MARAACSAFSTPSPAPPIPHSTFLNITGSWARGHYSQCLLCLWTAGTFRLPRGNGIEETTPSLFPCGRGGAFGNLKGETEHPQLVSCFLSCRKIHSGLFFSVLLTGLYFALERGDFWGGGVQFMGTPWKAHSFLSAIYYSSKTPVDQAL